MSPSHPHNSDAVLGGQNPQPIDTVVLGGLEGIKNRLASKDRQIQISALQEALKYEDKGLDLLVEIWKNDSNDLKWDAFSLLRTRAEEKVKLALAEYNPWLNLECIHTWEQDSDVKYITISKDGNTLFSGDGLGIHTWNIHTKERLPLFMENSNTCSFTISSNEAILVSRGGYYDSDNGMIIWNLRTGEWNTVLPEYGYMVSSVVTTPDNRYIICGSPDYKINVWDLETEKIVKKISSSKHLVQALALGNNGRILISAGTIKVWRRNNHASA